MLKDMNRLTRGVFLTTLGLVGLLIVGSIIGNFYLGARLAVSQNERVQVSATLDQVQEEYNGLYREYTDTTGGEPDAATPSQVNESVADTPGRPGAAGATGPQGPRGMMGERGQTGPVGPVGPAGEAGGVGAPGAAGSSGKDGLSGSNGKDGNQGEAGAAGAPGPTGPVGPQGLEGPQGVAGTNGVDGRGIAGMTCNTDGSWTISYTDNTSMTVGGPCRVFTEIPVG